MGPLLPQLVHQTMLDQLNSSLVMPVLLQDPVIHHQIHKAVMLLVMEINQIMDLAPRILVNPAKAIATIVLQEIITHQIMLEISRVDTHHLLHKIRQVHSRHRVGLVISLATMDQ